MGRYQQRVEGIKIGALVAGLVAELGDPLVPEPIAALPGREEQAPGFAAANEELPPRASQIAV